MKNRLLDYRVPLVVLYDIEGTLYPQANEWGPRGYISSDHIREKVQIYIVAFSFSLYHKYPIIGHNNISADMAINV